MKSLLETYGGGIAANNESVNDIFEKLSLLSNMKTENKPNEITQTSSLRDYLGEKHVIALLEPIL